VSNADPKVSIVNEPSKGAVYRKVASGAMFPPPPHEAPLIRLGAPTVLPLTDIGKALPRSLPGQLGAGVFVGPAAVFVAVGVAVAVAGSVFVGAAVGVLLGAVVGVWVGAIVAVLVGTDVEV
jgi:hypothetical protein